ncbi:hypothetical protein AVEN_237629-1 [Araneus ventricosus]|uniref:Uncharacterized protein n=1 Tax=Araneus ventricosus TaxID=182803 RepID=A0A4Y2JN67_ARAVE|nr:hypothetical protein AVEN_237629-1 [Araneus ventricosus]
MEEGNFEMDSEHYVPMNCSEYESISTVRFRKARPPLLDDFILKRGNSQCRKPKEVLECNVLQGANYFLREVIFCSFRLTAIRRCGRQAHREGVEVEGGGKSPETGPRGPARLG